MTVIPRLGFDLYYFVVAVQYFSHDDIGDCFFFFYQKQTLKNPLWFVFSHRSGGMDNLKLHKITDRCTKQGDSGPTDSYPAVVLFHRTKNDGRGSCGTCVTLVIQAIFCPCAYVGTFPNPIQLIIYWIRPPKGWVKYRQDGFQKPISQRLYD